MDDRGVERLKIAQILPEFEEGGVERHVLWLSNALAEMGHEATVITAGGKLEEKLDPRIALVRLPVHRKNPFTALYCAISIASRAKREGWNILHAHSRVPAWIAWWAARISGGTPWIMTAHARYSLNYGLRPVKDADGVISISHAVENHLKDFLPKEKVVIRNGLPPCGKRWKGGGNDPRRLLFVGRLTRIKGLDVVLEALSCLEDRRWIMDVLGDGPQRAELESSSRSLGISERVRFHGFCDDPGEWMEKSDLLLFPSLNEGLGLVLMQAIQIGLPVLASDLEPVRELVQRENGLLPPGDISAWSNALRKYFEGHSVSVSVCPGSIPSSYKMGEMTADFYQGIIESH